MASRVVITGATRGLGRAMTIGFARRGHHVVGCGRSREHLDELARSLGEPHDFRQVDVRGDGVEEWAEGVLERYGPPDLLINNAALINRSAPLWEITREEMEELIGVNVLGVYRVLAAFLPAMIERRSGVVVNLSSGWGRSTSPEVAPYCASKYAVEGMTKALAQELPQGMAAVALSPGVVDTDMLRSAWGEDAAAHPKPEAWAERAVPYLLSLGPKQNGASLTVS
ncbi:MAG: SDR family oxidoreductase [Thermoanaerobaculia bacterium]|nr:SDR family oxidoreductase [Thermoanaerobaculia bacterium]